MERHYGQIGQNQNPNKKRLKSKLNHSEIRLLGLKRQTERVWFWSKNLKSRMFKI